MPIEIDGSYLEGGGQILRISTALSVLLQKDIHIGRIRAGRKDGGLKAQHLTGIQIAADISKANVTGANLKSTEVTFVPNSLQSGRFVGDTKTAGSLCLLLQNVLPCLIFADEPCELDLRGGTNAEHAPQIDYFQMVFSPLASHFGIKTELEILRRGYYPKGGGEIYLKTFPIEKTLKPVRMTEFGTLKKVYGRAFVAGLPIKVADRMSQKVKELFSAYNDIPVDIEVVREREHSFVGIGTGVIIIAETSTGQLLAASALGKKGVSSEDVAKEAADFLKHDIECESCVDQYMQDQLIIFMALASGKSSVKCGPLTLHTKTAIHFTQLLTGAQFNVVELVKDRSYLIECEGISYERTKV